MNFRVKQSQKVGKLRCCVALKRVIGDWISVNGDFCWFNSMTWTILSSYLQSQDNLSTPYFLLNSALTYTFFGFILPPCLVSMWWNQEIRSALFLNNHFFLPFLSAQSYPMYFCLVQLDLNNPTDIAFSHHNCSLMHQISGLEISDLHTNFDCFNIIVLFSYYIYIFLWSFPFLSLVCTSLSDCQGIIMKPFCCLLKNLWIPTFI